MSNTLVHEPVSLVDAARCGSAPEIVIRLGKTLDSEIRPESLRSKASPVFLDHPGRAGEATRLKPVPRRQDRVRRPRCVARPPYSRRTSSRGHKVRGGCRNCPLIRPHRRPICAPQPLLRPSAYPPVRLPRSWLKSGELLSINGCPDRLGAAENLCELNVSRATSATQPATEPSPDFS